MRKLHSQIETYRDVELTEDCNMTLGEWLDKWLNDYMALTIGESTMDSYKTMTKRYTKPLLGDEKISSVTTADIQKMYNWLRENGRVNEHYEKGNAFSDSMIRSIHMMLHQAIDASDREKSNGGDDHSQEQLCSETDPDGGTAGAVSGGG